MSRSQQLLKRRKSELPLAERLARRPSLLPLDPAQRYSVDEAIAYLRSSRKSLFDDIREGRLLTFKEGRRRYVPGSEIARRSRLDGGYADCAAANDVHRRDRGPDHDRTTP